METRKSFETVVLHDAAIDWDAMKNPPLLEQPCPKCDGEPGMLGSVKCVACDGRGSVQVHEYEPCDEVRFANERDLAFMRKLSGAEPTVYVYRRLTRSQQQKFISLAASFEDRAIRAFQAGVIEIRLPGKPAYRPAWLARAALTMDEKELETIERDHGIEYADMLDVGSQVLARSAVPFGCTPLFPVLPSSVDAWGAVQRRCAARKAAAALQTNDAPKEA